MSYETTSLTVVNESSSSPFQPPSPPPPSSSSTTTAANNDAKQISKLILRSALQKANAAVQCDSTNDVLGAINAYNEAISLLERVLATVDKENDRRRLQEIHDSYSERIRLLSTITTKLEPAVDQPIYQQPLPTTPTLSTNKRDQGIANEEEKEEEEQEEYDLDEVDDEDEDEEETIQRVEKAWLSSNPNNTAKQAAATPIIKKMASTSSMGYHNQTSPPNTPSFTATTATKVRYVSQDQKEKFSQLPVSPPPPIPLPPIPTSSSSTSLHQHHHHHHHPITAAAAEEITKTEKGKVQENILDRQQEPNIPRPSSNRSSLSSIDSSISEASSSIESAIYEQPTMTLPSLKKEAAVKKSASNSNVFRARTSSLPKSPTSPTMQRSSSMSTVENLLVDEEETEHQVQQKAMSVLVQQGQQQSKQKLLPTPLTISRPPISRPSLGSMRKKAVNRLSMDAFTLKKSATATSVSSNGSSTGNHYGLFLKDEMDYDGNQQQMQPQHPMQSHYQYQQQQQQVENHSATPLGHATGSGHLKLLLALEKSMMEGAHITQKLYIPKNLWQQPNIRLSSMDIKVSACEQLMNDIARLENWTYLDDLMSSARLLDQFESSVDALQQNLHKKLKRDSLAAEASGNSSESPNSASSNSSGSVVHSGNSRDSMATIGRMDSGKKTQSILSWGTKLTKSVERMNAFSLTKTEDQYRHYIEALQKLFHKIHILENWLNYYNLEKRKAATKQAQHDVLIMKLIKICSVINHVVGGFVIGDITILLAKWLKRGGSWVNE